MLLVSRFQIIPRSSVCAVGDTITGLEEHGHATVEQATERARIGAHHYALRYGAGCPASDLVEVEDIPGTEDRDGVRKMRVVRRFEVNT